MDNKMPVPLPNISDALETALYVLLNTCRGIICTEKERDETYLRLKKYINERDRNNTISERSEYSKLSSHLKKEKERFETQIALVSKIFNINTSDLANYVNHVLDK